MQIETDRAGERDLMDAVLAAATSRMRPLMLTAISTVLGLHSDRADGVLGTDGIRHYQRQVLVATLLTLIFLPTVYVTVFGGTGERCRFRRRQPDRRTAAF